LKKFVPLFVVLVAAAVGCDVSKNANSNQNNVNVAHASAATPKIAETPAAEATPKPGIIAKLRTAKGKYPYELKLLDDPELKSRLTKLLGVDFAAMKANWDVETPIEIENGILMTSGCEQHNCGGNMYYMFVDLERDNINVYHVENGERLYSEKGRIDLPKKFSDEIAPGE